MGVLLGVVLGVLVPGTAAAGSDGDGRGPDVLFRFTDRAIIESSGLVDTGEVVYTANDSGAGAVLYAVDPATGDTTSRTAYSRDEVVDVEALAPGRGGTVWVGDIGDNPAARDRVSLYRVRPGTAQRSERLDLTYPDGPRDAEALLAHPRDGRLFVVSKTPFGAIVYAVPRTARPGAASPMRAFARVPGLVTDGAFLPDGRHVLLRSYGTASVYAFPGFELRGTVELPDQRQGEGISVSPQGRVLLSSEGVGSDVVRVTLPARLTAERPAPSAASAAASPSADPSRDPGRPDRRGRDIHPVAFGLRVLAGLVLLTTIGFGLRRLLRQSA